MDYAIGDVQGCFNSLNALLKKINFNIDRDRLFFLGDVVNRGPHSLETLRFIYSHKDNIDMVLGNHDFHLLVCAFTERSPNKKDTFQNILNASDKIALLQYLLNRPLVIEYEDALMVHAGVPPNWSQSDVINNAALVHQHLQNGNPSKFLSLMYGNSPHTWSDALTIEEKCRYTINALMRMRFCKEDGGLEFEHKLYVDNNLAGYKAWFLHKNRVMKEQKIFFGHWSSLKNVDIKNIYPLDHGCFWGGHLTAYNLTNQNYISQKSVEN
jgi:bis(5'-nucleosyl)-tetraphosphatase (symmetrical)